MLLKRHFNSKSLFTNKLTIKKTIMIFSLDSLIMVINNKGINLKCDRIIDYKKLNSPIS